MDGRQARGRVLAQAHGDRIKQVDGPLWFVPSSQDGGGYLVNVETGKCGCPDEAERCKHVVAVELVRGTMVKADSVPAMAAPVVTPPAKVPPPKGDLTPQEQAHVRAALRFLRTRCGGWAAVAKGTRFSRKSLENVAYGTRPSGSLTIRLARLAGVPVDDVLTGRFPLPGTCAHCGRGPA